MAGQKAAKEQFDPVRLQNMAEPLTLRIAKIKGNVQQPIELPSKDGGAPGTNWTRDEVLKLEGWLLNEWSGGGYYRATVNDVKGVEMTWEWVFDPRLYPERVPPNTAGAAYVSPTPPTAPGVPVMNPAQPQPLPPGVQPLGAGGPTGWPPIGATYATGYGNPPHSGPIMMQAAQPPPPPVIVQMPAQSQQQPQGPWAQQQPPQGQWQQTPWGPQWQGPPQGQPQWGPQSQWGSQPQPQWGPQPQQSWPGAGYGRRQSAFDDEFGNSPRRRPLDTSHRDDYEERERVRRETEEREKIRREAEDRQRSLENQLRQAELNQKESEYKAALDRNQQAADRQMQQIQQTQTQQIAELRQQSDTQIRTLQEELRRLAEHKAKPEDEEVRRLREEQQRAREQAAIEQQKLREEQQRAREQAVAEQQRIQQAAAAEQQRLQQQITDQQLAAMRQASEAQVLALREQLGRMNEKPTGESDEMRRLREEQERQRQAMEQQRLEYERRTEAEQQKHERERDRLEQQRRDEMVRQEIKEQRGAFEKQLEALANSQAARGSDPVIEALKESARAQAESMREVARMQTAQTDRMSSFMVAPAQLAQIMKDNSSGSDGLMRNVVDSVSGIVNMYKTAAEQIMQMSGAGGEPPAARLIQEGIGRASEIAERYLAVKRDQVIGDTKVKQAQAQVDVARAQVEGQVRAEAQARAAAAQQMAAARMRAQQQQQQAGGGLDGAAPAPAPSPSQARPQPQPRPQQARPQPQVVQRPTNGSNGQGPHAAQAPDQAETPPVEGGQVVGRIMPTQRPPTEEEMFGIAIESVHRLRKGVVEGKLEPSGAIDAILKGVAYVASNSLTIPAFVLFEQERWADFVDVLLPQATSEFKAECVRILAEEIEVVENEDPEDVEDEGEAVSVDEEINP